MKIGAFVPLGAYNANAEFVRTLGPAVEERGFESIWVAEHVVLFDEYSSQYPYSPDGKFPGGGGTGLLEPLTALAYLAAITDSVRLGTGICLITQRNPVYTAKQVADVDVLSGGRVELGVGIGWLKEEFDALNMPFERRGLRADDHLKVMRSLWTDETSSYSGELYELPPCRFYPKPVQSPLPVLVGGESDAAMRRAAELGQGWYGYNRTPDQVPEALTRLDAILAEAGRSRDDGFSVTICPAFNRVDRDDIARYAELGVDRVNVVIFGLNRDTLLTALDAAAEELVLPAEQLTDG